jgi:predicted alpha/beta-fold hydrolase
MATALNGGDVPIYYKRKLFEAEDLTYAGTFAVDFVTAPYGGSDGTLPPRTTYFTDEEFASVGSEDSRPMLVCLHGLSGGSYELYLRECLAPLVSKMGGWEACVVNSRGCAMSKITSQILYNARATWDIRQTMKWLRKKFPNRLFFGLGFSLGANILTNVRLSYELNCKDRLN